VKVRIIQWNISFKANADKIVEFLLNSVSGHTIITLQEVLESVHQEISSKLNADDVACSLSHRSPGKFEGKNRKMGVATYAFGGSIESSSLISRSIFPERTLQTAIKFEDTSINLLTFHSITGCDYKKAKSSNFASIADFLHEHDLDFFTCDANEPKVDSINDNDIVFFDNKDKGKNAGLILGATKVHVLNDAYKTYSTNSGNELDSNPLATSHVVSKKYHRRYDHVYHNNKWKVDSVVYPYGESIDASSDHSAVIGDFYTL